MSASLVGSEMCIRDRVRSRKGRKPDEPRGTSAIPGQGLLGVSEVRNLLCLLYTSDAADDM
eukprot:226277-Alexandrium_andersonii.AAC.1